jgi:hypothetical protein
MMISVAGTCGLVVLTDDEIAAVAGGIIRVPDWPPFQPPQRPPRTDPLPPPGGYTP